MQIRSEQTLIQCSDEKIYQLVSNCSHFGKYLPPDITDFEATEDYCKFSMKNIADFKIEIVQKNPFNLVRFQVLNDKNIPITLSIHIEKDSSNSKLWIDLNAEIPFILQGMVKSPLQKFVDILSERIKMESEK